MELPTLRQALIVVQPSFSDSSRLMYLDCMGFEAAIVSYQKGDCTSIIKNN